jgi:hypothetical protein
MENMIGIGKRTIKIDKETLRFSFDMNAQRIVSKLQGTDLKLDLNADEETQQARLNEIDKQVAAVDAYTPYENMSMYVRAGLMSANPKKEFTEDYVQLLFYYHEDAAAELTTAVMEGLNLQKKMTNSMKRAAEVVMK